MKVGDVVIYDGIKYTIEKDYGNQVFLIGNEDTFVDMVPSHMLTPEGENHGIRQGNHDH